MTHGTEGDKMHDEYPKLPKKMEKFSGAYSVVLQRWKYDQEKTKKIRKVAKHTIRVMKIVKKIMGKTGLSPIVCDAAILSACLHDVMKFANNKQHHTLAIQWIKLHPQVFEDVLPQSTSKQENDIVQLLRDAVLMAVLYHKGKHRKFLKGTHPNAYYIGECVGRAVRYADKLDKCNKGKSWWEVKAALRKSKEYFDYSKKNKPKWCRKIEEGIDNTTQTYLWYMQIYGFENM